MKTILTVKDLEISFRTRSETVRAIRNISLDVYEGEILAIVGESGSGKTVLTKSFINMLGDTGYITNGKIICDANTLDKPIDVVQLHRDGMDGKYRNQFRLINKKKIKKLQKNILQIKELNLEKTKQKIQELTNKIDSLEKTYVAKNNYRYLAKRNVLHEHLTHYAQLLHIVTNNQQDVKIEKNNKQIEFLKNEIKKFHGTRTSSKTNARKTINLVRGKTIASIFQDPMTSLNPLLSVGFQISESLRKHCGLTRNQAKKEAINLLEKVGVQNAAKRYHDIPSKYSGGMRQRVVIAIALASRPKILIADEPTTALDVTVQTQILELLKSLQKEYKLTIIFITHDLGVVANIANRVAVMYAGQIVEYGEIDEIFFNPQHPYT
jgi:oligopeptide transport system ATP-binding protein